MKRLLFSAFCLFAVVSHADTVKMTPLTVFVDGTNETLRAANAYTDAHSGGGGGGKVKSVNGKDGEVVLTAEDVHALPDTYTPPPSPVQSVNGKTGAVQLGAAEEDAALYTALIAVIQDIAPNLVGE